MEITRKIRHNVALARATGRTSARLPVAHAPVRFVIFAAVCVFLVAGCNKAEVESAQSQFQPDVQILEPAYAMARKDAPWYSNMQVLFEEKPLDEKDLEAKVNAGRDEVRKNVEALLQEIGAAIETKHNANDKWNIVGVSCGRGKKPNEIHFEAEVGRTKLFERRPLITFSNVRLQNCIAKLCRETELQESQPRGHNPSVTWEKQHVSAYEAMQTLLNVNGFDYKFIDASYKLPFKAQDYASRQEFIDAVKKAVLEKGDALNTLRPAIVVTPKVKPDEPKKDASTGTGIATGTSTSSGTGTGTKSPPAKDTDLHGAESRKKPDAPAPPPAPDN